MPNTAADSGEAAARPAIHIAVGALVAADGRVLIARRRPGTPGAGLWEFPGGKCEPGEGVEAALTRELDEELGVQVQRAHPLLSFHHDYADRRVLLDVWRVTDWRGNAHGREGQPVAWCAPQRLHEYELLPANGPLVTALRLPPVYVISPAFGGDEQAFIRAAQTTVQTTAQAGAGLLRLRAPQLNDEDYARLASGLRNARPDAALMLDRDPAMVEHLNAAGLHLPAARLGQISARPVPADRWFAVSCHNRHELEQAQAAGADFAVLSPVKPTASHPQAEPLGWAKFQSLRELLPLPVYALGGLTRDDLPAARHHGAQGVAGISAFWSG